MNIKTKSTIAPSIEFIWVKSNIKSFKSSGNVEVK